MVLIRNGCCRRTRSTSTRRTSRTHQLQTIRREPLPRRCGRNCRRNIRRTGLRAQRKNRRVYQRTRLRAERCKLRSNKHRRGRRACSRTMWRFMDRAEVQCSLRVTPRGTHDFKFRAFERHSSDLAVKTIVLEMAHLNHDTVNCPVDANCFSTFRHFTSQTRSDLPMRKSPSHHREELCEAWVHFSHNTSRAK